MAWRQKFGKMLPGPVVTNFSFYAKPGIILSMCPANKRWHYSVTSSLIGWAIRKIILTRKIIPVRSALPKDKLPIELS